jgi:hypothetical protein
MQDNVSSALDKIRAAASRYIFSVYTIDENMQHAQQVYDHMRHPFPSAGKYIDGANFHLKKVQTEPKKLTHHVEHLKLLLCFCKSVKKNKNVWDTNSVVSHYRLQQITCPFTLFLVYTSLLTQHIIDAVVNQEVNAHLIVIISDTIKLVRVAQEYMPKLNDQYGNHNKALLETDGAFLDVLLTVLIAFLRDRFVAYNLSEWVYPDFQPLVYYGRSGQVRLVNYHGLLRDLVIATEGVFMFVSPQDPWCNMDTVWHTVCHRLKTTPGTTKNPSPLPTTLQIASHRPWRKPLLPLHDMIKFFRTEKKVRYFEHGGIPEPANTNLADQEQILKWVSRLLDWTKNHPSFVYIRSQAAPCAVSSIWMTFNLSYGQGPNQKYTMHEKSNKSASNDTNQVTYNYSPGFQSNIQMLRHRVFYLASRFSLHCFWHYQRMIADGLQYLRPAIYFVVLSVRYALNALVHECYHETICTRTVNQVLNHTLFVVVQMQIFLHAHQRHLDEHGFQPDLQDVQLLSKVCYLLPLFPPENEYKTLDLEDPHAITIPNLDEI